MMFSFAPFAAVQEINKLRLASSSYSFSLVVVPAKQIGPSTFRVMVLRFPPLLSSIGMVLLIRFLLAVHVKDKRTFSAVHVFDQHQFVFQLLLAKVVKGVFR